MLGNGSHELEFGSESDVFPFGRHGVDLPCEAVVVSFVKLV